MYKNFTQQRQANILNAFSFVIICLFHCAVRANFIDCPLFYSSPQIYFCQIVSFWISIITIVQCTSIHCVMCVLWIHVHKIVYKHSNFILICSAVGDFYVLRFLRIGNSVYFLLFFAFKNNQIKSTHLLKYNANKHRRTVENKKKRLILINIENGAKWTHQKLFIFSHFLEPLASGNLFGAVHELIRFRDYFGVRRMIINSRSIDKPWRELRRDLD